MEEIKVGDVVYLRSNPDRLMTVENIVKKYLISGLLYEKYDSPEKYDVGVVYFNGGVVIHDSVKLGALESYSKLSL